jgi:cytoskeletal protein CcmA (bactofilin family)
MSWMRQPSESEPSRQVPPERFANPRPAPESERTFSRTGIIGSSIKIKGKLTGGEDLTIDGTVEGTVSLEGHTLTLGPHAHIKAEVRADTVVVAGEVTGNIAATEKIEIASTGSVHGDISSPRLSIADGARLKGSIDSDRTETGASKPSEKPSASSTPREQKASA